MSELSHFRNADNTPKSERQQPEIRRFTDQAREELTRAGYGIFELQGKSLGEMIEGENRVVLGVRNPDVLKDVRTDASEVAIHLESPTLGGWKQEYTTNPEQLHNKAKLAFQKHITPDDQKPSPVIAQWRGMVGNHLISTNKDQSVPGSQDIEFVEDVEIRLGNPAEYAALAVEINNPLLKEDFHYVRTETQTLPAREVTPEESALGWLGASSFTPTYLEPARVAVVGNIDGKVVVYDIPEDIQKSEYEVLPLFVPKKPGDSSTETS